MAHTPKPHGAFQQGGPASEEDAGAAAHFLKRLQAVKTAGDLPSHKMVRDLPSGGQVIAQDMGGVVKTIIIKPELQQYESEPLPEQPDDGLAQMFIPMLYSANVLQAVVDSDGGVPVKLTPATQRRLVGYDDETELPGSIQELHRFKVPYHKNHKILEPLEPQPGKFYTHFAELHSTWYTGAMAAVVQIVKGFGITDNERLPEAERVQLSVPESVRLQIEAEMGNIRLPGYSGKPPKNGEIQFDFQHHHTNGVGFDGKGKPWLLKVWNAEGYEGVWAMPLPTIPATATKAFREWMEDVGDTEILSILDKFGAIPSGEGFPEQEKTFEAWRKAGVIIKVCDLGDFYEHRSYSSFCGFAFNSKATEGYATCWKDNQFKSPNKGFAYKLSITLGAADDDGKLKPGYETEDEATRNKVNNYLAALYEYLKDSYDGDPKPIYYKVRRHTAEEIVGLAESGAGPEYWINKEFDPIAKHSGKCTKVSEGFLIAGQIENVKFPGLFVTGPACLSAYPAISWPEDDESISVDNHPRCDTIVHGFFDGEDQLKVVKYFREPQKEGDEGDDPPECPYYGSHSWNGPSTGKGILGNFYTTDFDEREVKEIGYTTYTTSGEHMMSGEWRVQQESFFWTYFQVERYEYYLHTYEEVSVDRHEKSIGTLVPWGMRAAYLYATGEADHVLGTLKDTSWSARKNANSPGYWSFDSGMAWIGSPRNGETPPYRTYGKLGFEYAIYDQPPKPGSPPEPNCYPETHEAWEYPGEGEVANELRSPTWRYEGSGGMQGGVEFHHEAPKWKPYREETGPEKKNEKYAVHFAFKGEPIKIGDKYVPDYFRPSPELQALAAYWVWGCANCFGDNGHVFISDGMRHFNPSVLVPSNGIPRFIGVIHE